MSQQDHSRRSFLTQAAVATGGMMALGGAASGQTNTIHQIGRRAIEGSPYPTFSRAIVYNGVVYVAGVVGQKPGTQSLVSDEFEPQCRQALENLKASVEAAGATMNNVLKCTCYLTDDDDFPIFNMVYVDYFPQPRPARSSVIVDKLVVPKAKLEIDCIAAV